MDQRILDYATYNLWANERLIDNLSELSEEILEKEVLSSFPSIRKTALHIWYGETGWLSRLNNKGWEASHVDTFSGTTKELFHQWLITSKEFVDFVMQADLEKEIEFSSHNKTFSIAGRDMAHTVLNHGSYHRGQLVTILRQLGINKVNQTDYIHWLRETKSSYIIK